MCLSLYIKKVRVVEMEGAFKVGTSKVLLAATERILVARHPPNYAARTLATSTGLRGSHHEIRALEAVMIKYRRNLQAKSNACTGGPIRKT